MKLVKLTIIKHSEITLIPVYRKGNWLVVNFKLLCNGRVMDSGSIYERL
jgi:hypothetical protein